MNEPAWLTALIDQRLALLEQHIGDVPGYDVVFTLLVENPMITPARNERTCDNPGCQAYCPHPTPFFTGVIERQLRGGKPVLMGYGVCAACKRQLD